ncbi:MAG TPA: response regulator [Candidatus Paceibacterota bacterium]
MTEEKKYKILLVDDDKFLLDMYALKFKAAGHEAFTSANTAETLQRLRDGDKFEIILLDIIMPGMDGLELLETIKKEKLAEGATIIMLTNESDQEKISKAKSLGVSGYIVKATLIPSEVVEEVIKIVKNN